MTLTNLQIPPRAIHATDAAIHTARGAAVGGAAATTGAAGERPAPGSGAAGPRPPQRSQAAAAADPGDDQAAAVASQPSRDPNTTAERARNAKTH